MLLWALATVGLAPPAHCDREWTGRWQTDLANVLSDTATQLQQAVVIGLGTVGGDREEYTARRAADSLLATAAAVQTTKLIIHSPRPDKPEKDGFPSGHAAMAFCLATVLAERHEELGAWPYVYASGVAWSRIELGRHTVGQVLAGVGLGYMVGNSSAKGQVYFGQVFVPDHDRFRGMPGFEPPPQAATPVLPLLQVTW